MSPSIVNNTPQNKILNCIEQDSEASKGVHYCHKSLSEIDTVCVENLAVRFDAHWGIESFDAAGFIVDTLAKNAGITCSDDLVREIEGILALFVSASKSVDMVGVMASVFLYIRSKYDTSLSGELIKYICSEIGYSTQSGLEDETQEPRWLQFLKKIRTDWKSCVNDGLFSIFSKIFSLLVVLGISKTANLTFSLGGFKLLEPDLKLINGRATDICTAACDVVIFFFERCYHAWVQGSFKPFFTSSPESAKLEVAYSQCLNHWELYQSGNLMKVAKVSEHDFLRETEDIGDKLKALIPSAKGIDKRLLEEKYRTIVKIIGNFNLIKVNSGFKQSPFAIEYYGLSKVGKSTLSEQVAHYLFSSAGLSTDSGRKYTHVSGKKHWDGARSDMLELKLDDHANTKEKYVESSPCDVIVKVCNNVPFSPPMADLHDKGKVWVQPELVSLTTNKLDLDARVYSNNPYSIQRRMHYVVHVKVKQEFADIDEGVNYGIDTEKVIAAHTIDGEYRPPLYHDIWELEFLRAVPATRETVAATYEVLEVDGKKMTKLSMMEACNFLCDEFHKHREQQNKLESTQNQTVTVMRCSHEGCNQLHGYCTAHSVSQVGLENLRLSRVLDRIRDTEYTRVTTDLLQRSRDFYDRFDWVPMLPRRVIDSKVFELTYSYFNRKELLASYGRYSACNFGGCCLFGANLFVFQVGASTQLFGVLILILIFLFVQYLLITFVREQQYARLRRRHTLTQIHVHWQNMRFSEVFAASLALGALYQIAKLIKRWRSMEQHGSLEPADEEAVSQRDAEENVWAVPVRRSLPVTEKSARMSVDHVQDVVSKALVYGSVHLKSGENAMVNGLMLKSNAMLVPDHYFEQYGPELSCTFRKKNPEASGGKFKVLIHVDQTHRIPNTDLRVCYVANGGSYKDLTDMFPLSQMGSVPFRMLWRKKDGDLMVFKGLTVPKHVTTCCTFMGGEYKNLTGPTFEGLCGATLFSETTGSAIIGIHLGGIGGTTKGCYGSIERGQLQLAYADLETREGVVLTGSAGEFPKEVLGVEIMKDAPLHAKSPLRYMPHNSQVEYLGTCVGRTTTTSNVQVTLISEHVTDICGVPNVYGPPKMQPDWYGWQTCLANLANPGTMFSYAVLKIAVQDYKSDLVQLVKRDMWRAMKPLSDFDNIHGIPGCKFIDAIKMDTSIGFPLSGPKRNFITESEPDKTGFVKREFDTAIVLEIERCENLYRCGERAYPIAKACKKDEILSKSKCRIFYGNAMALTFLIRKYYLPILRFMQMNPLVSECAVGINAHGPEWEEFQNHVLKFGENRVLGGDYGCYDQKLPTQMIIAALRVLIDLASHCQYTEEDIRVMRAMVGDIVFAYICFNGDLIGLTSGTHISGNSLTVAINGICGSLNLRCVYYTVYPAESFETRRPFRENVALCTYGDDNIGSVREGNDRFNIKVASEILAAHGQQYTMPDKTSELRDYLPIEQFEFLKRKNVYHPKLQSHVGALLDKSIFKSLHCYIREKNSPITPSQACALNIDTALREWFNHGEEVYEQRRVQMCEIAKRSGISHMCHNLDTPYEVFAQSWVAQYRDTG